VNRAGLFALMWGAGLVTGLLIRSSSTAHGHLPAIVLVIVNAGIFGAVYRLGGRS
jgi:hypothetical protein